MKQYTHKISLVSQYVREHLQEKLDLAQLAQVAHLSPYHFHRIFRALSGETVHSFVNRLRMEYAANRLKFTDWKIGDIASSAGFDNPETFSRAFVKHFGHPPRDFRKVQLDITETRIENIIKKRLSETLIPVRIESIGELKVAYVEHKGPYHKVGQAWGRLLKSVDIRSKPLLIGIPYNDPMITEKKLIRYDACIALDMGVSLKEGMPTRTLEGGLFAIGTHKGSFDAIDDSYNLMYGLWLSNSGYTLRDVPGREVYLNSLDKMEKKELISDIYLPIKK